MDLSLPLHNYFGPGNQLNNGQPQSQSDFVAQIHDHRYAIAKEAQDVFNADREAIGEFLSLVGTDPFAAIGALGLAGKSIIENKFGLIYPNMSPIGGAKRSRDELQIDSSVQEESIIENSTGAVQDGQSVGGGTGASVGPNSTVNIPQQRGQVITFKKCVQLYTGAMQFTVLDTDELNKVTAAGPKEKYYEPGNNCIVTPLAVIDPNNASWFLTPKEFEYIPRGSYAKACRIKVTPLGYRLPFATNEKSAGYANSQTLVQICHSIGIEKHMAVAPRRVETDDTDLTKTTAVYAKSYSGLYGARNLADLLYGDKTTNATIPASFGIPRHYNYYACIPYMKDHFPLFNRYYTIENVNDLKGVPLIDYKYEYKNGLLKYFNSKYSLLLKDAWVNDGLAGFPQSIWQKNKSDEHTESPTWSHIGISEYENADSLEKSGYTSVVNRNRQSPNQPPFIYFGCMPIQSNAPLAAAPVFSPGVVQWKVETELDVFVNINYENVGYGDYVSFAQYDAVHLAGNRNNKNVPSDRMAGKAVWTVKPEAFYNMEQDGEENLEDGFTPVNYTPSISSKSSLGKRMSRFHIN